VIYTVESNFSDPGREVEWNAWYETYLTQLVSLPGLTDCAALSGSDARDTGLGLFGHL